MQGKRVHDPILPLVGVEAYFREDRTIRDDKEVLREYYHMVLIARNLKGWHNLLRLTSEAYATGFYQKACIDYELLERYHEGLCCTMSCISGFVPYQILHDGQPVIPGATRGYDSNRIAPHIKRLKGWFGEHLYAEIMPHDFDAQRTANVELTNLCARESIPVLATNDAHYPYKDWADTQDVVLMISTGQTFDKRAAKVEKGEDVYTFDTPTLYITSEDEMRQMFRQHHPDLPPEVVDEAINNTSLLASRVEPFLVDKAPKMPRVKGGEVAAEKIVRGWCKEGLDRIAELYPHWTDEMKAQYTEQMEKEMAIFNDKGVIGYFVIIGDMVRWAKSQRIRVGAGRGSAAGSLVLYLCGVTAVDPIAHKLSFERFLNPHREGMPDVDLDFQHNRRAEVKEYLGMRWGADHVADIISHGTFGLRSALGAVARAYDVPHMQIIELTKYLDDGHGDLSLQDVMEISPELQTFVKDTPNGNHIWKHALRLEGQVRNVSKHAAGVVVTDRPVADTMPTMRGNDGSTVTAWSEQADFPIISKYGYLKIDVLGTDGLTVEADAVEHIEQHHGVPAWNMRHGLNVCWLDELPVVWDPDAVDPDVIAGFTESTLAVFQFEGRGISGLLRQIKPTSFRDLVAANALYRPGPLESGTAFSYGNRKNGKEPEEYPAEAARATLGETYGIMVYQEQAIQLVQDLAGFSAAEADVIRRNITKLSSAKVSDNRGRMELERTGEEIIRRGVEHGTPEPAMKRFIEELKYATRYSFNKSHSAGYSLQSYQDMHLKMHFPSEMYAAYMTWETEKVPMALREAQGRGIAIKPPDVNISDRGFTLDNGAIRFGLEPVRYVGDGAIEEIVKNRPYTSYEDFAERVPARRCNSRAKTALLMAGAFDSLGCRYKFTSREKAGQEREQLGISLSDSSLADHRELIAARAHTVNEMEALGDGASVTLGGEITRATLKKTRRGQDMAFVDVVFGGETYECVVWSPTVQYIANLLKEGNVVMAKGRWFEDGGIQISEMALCDDVERHLNGDG